MAPPTIHAEDPTHPIPVVDSLDVYGVKKGGGARLVIVIASPLEAEQRSLACLVQKMRNYLGCVASGKFRAECGDPTIDNTEIEVLIHPDSDAGVFDFLEQCADWCQDNRARLVITVPSPLLLGKAKLALERILSDSELEEGWDTDEDLAAWQAGVFPLKDKLARFPSAPVPPGQRRPWWKFW